MNDEQQGERSSGGAPPPRDRRRIRMLALALAVSWAAMLFHNQWELPLTPLDLENTGPLLVDIALFLACVRWPSSRLAWGAVLTWGLLNMVVGGILTVLPLPVLPFIPEQTIDHYAVHAVYALGQLPLVLVASAALRRPIPRSARTHEEVHND